MDLCLSTTGSFDSLIFHYDFGQEGSNAFPLQVHLILLYFLTFSFPGSEIFVFLDLCFFFFQLGIRLTQSLINTFWKTIMEHHHL